LLLHLRNHGADGPEDTLDVDVEAALELVDGHFERWLCWSQALLIPYTKTNDTTCLVPVTRACVVDDRVHTSPLGHCGLYDSLPVCLGGDVRLVDKSVFAANLVRGGPGAGFVDVGNDNAAPLCSEAL